MASEKGSPMLEGLGNFFTSFTHSFSKLMLTNLLFALPLAVSFGIFYLISVLTGLNSILIMLIGVIPAFPFYAGVTLVTSNLVRNEEVIDVFGLFVAGIKDNFLRFLVHGIVFYAALFFSYYSISIYVSMLGDNFLIYGFLCVSIVIALFFLFLFYYLPAMTVTFDLPMSKIYKNCALMTFGEMKRSLFATFGVLIIALVCATVLMCCMQSVAIIIATIILGLFFVPSILSFVINSAIYKNMYYMIVDKNKKSERIDKKIENRKNGQFFDNFEEEGPNIIDDFTDVDLDESKDPEEYIFYNGKMVKRGVLFKLKKEQEAKNAKK